MIKFIRDKAHCKHVAYTNEEVNDLLNGKANKADFHVLTGQIEMVSGNGTVTVSYPNGFTKDNCVVISYGQETVDANKGYSYGYGTSSAHYIDGSLSRNVRLTDTNIEVIVKNPVSETDGNKTYNYKIVLMKIA